MTKRFEPVEGRNAEIIESVMNCDEVKNLSEDIKFKIRLCVEEVEENILGYSGSTWVDVKVDKSSENIEIAFQDGGVEFNPLAKEDPDITASVDDRQVGGLGIFLCKQMMDSMDYSFSKGCNILRMKIKIK